MSWEVFRRLRPIRGPRSLCAVLRLGCGERLPCPMRRTVTEYRSWKRALILGNSKRWEEHSGREDGQYREPLVEEAAFCRRSEQHGANRADREPDGSENSEPRAADIRRRERSNDGSRTVAKPSRVLTSAVTATRPQSPSTNGNMTRAIVGPLATITSDRRMPNRSYATPESGLMQMPSAKNVPKGDWRRSPKALSPRSDTSGRSS